VKIAFVGTDGFSVRAGITTHLLEGGEIIKVMRERAERTIVLADSSKYGAAGAVTILPLSSVDGFITDAGVPEDAAAVMKEVKGIQDITVEREGNVVKFWFMKE
jgi:DeoR family galactitol utilization operon repressor